MTIKYPLIKPGFYQWEGTGLFLTASPAGEVGFYTQSFQIKLLDQKDEFITVEIYDNQSVFQGFKGIGVLKKNNNTFDLYIVTNIPDNRLIILTPECSNEYEIDSFNGIIVKTSNFIQTPTPFSDNSLVSSVKVTWLNY